MTELLNMREKEGASMCLTVCCLAAFGLKGKEARTQACELRL